MSRSRREFLRDTSIAVALIPGLARAKTRKSPLELPAMIATWDYGVTLCTEGQKVFSRGGDVLDALEKGVNAVENDPAVHTVGYNSWPNEDGVVQLDASIMDGRGHRAGAVGALEGIKNPISVARLVMDKTNHVLLVGAGALAFAKKMGFKEESLITAELKAEWQQSKRDSFWKDRDNHDTVCAIGIDAQGNLASAVSTSGLNNKLPGRLGDSPIIGAGNYCDNDVGAACATGIGELTLKTMASFAIVERMRAGVAPKRACDEVLARVVRKYPGLETDAKAQLALIAMNKAGAVGAAALRKQKKLFRYALVRGVKNPPTLVDVKTLIAS